MRLPLTAMAGVIVLALLLTGSPNGVGGGTARPVAGPPVARASAPLAPAPVITILPNGSVNPTGSVLSGSGNTYTLTTSYAGSIVDERNGSTIDGAGHTLTTYPGTAPGLSLLGVSGVLVTGLNVTNSSAYAYYVSDAVNVTLRADSIGVNRGFGLEAIFVNGLTVASLRSQSTGPLQVQDASHLDLQSNDLAHAGGIDVTYATSVLIQANNLSYAIGDSISVAECSGVTVDDNTLYQNASGPYDDLYLYEDSRVEVTDDRGSGGSDFALLSFVDDATFTGVTLPGASNTGIFAQDSANLTLQDDNFTRAAQYALDFQYSTNIDVINVTGNHAGYEGAYVDYSGRLLFLADNFSGATANGMYLDYLNNLSLTGIDASDELGAGASGFYAYNCNEITLTGDRAVHNSYGLYAEYSSALTLSYDDFTNELNTGLRLDTGSAVTVSGLNTSGSPTGLFLSSLQGAAFDNVSAAGASVVGINLQSSVGVSLLGIDANRSGLYGLEVYQCEQVTVSDLWSNGLVLSSGIYVYNSQHVVLTGLHVAGERFGAQLYSTSDLALLASNLSSDQDGVVFDGLTGLAFAANSFWNDNFSFLDYGGNLGSIYHNNFLGDRGWALRNYYLSDQVAWNSSYPTGGNFWSNYTGADTESGAAQNLPGSDGIGDSPFALNATTEDHYPLVHAWTSATITFVETGLAPGTTWTVSLNGQAELSRTNLLVVLEEDGATAPFNYAVPPIPGYHVTPASGGGSEDGQDVQIALAFTPVNATVTFQAAGVAAGVPWSVDVGGRAFAGTGPTLVAEVPNGTYAYLVGGIPGYTVTPMTGSVSVAGATEVTLSAIALLVNLTFTESGLPSGASWSVVVNGVSKSSTTSTITFAEPDGTYTYSVGAVGGYSANPSAGTASVLGAPTRVPIAYASTGIFTGAALGLLIALIAVAIAAVAGWVLFLRRRSAQPPGLPGQHDAPAPSPPPAPPPG